MLIAELVQRLDAWFPPPLAESWDNVGLLLGDPRGSVRRVMTCLTVTAVTAREAIEQQAELIVAHHPIFFRPVQRLRADGADGYLYDVARSGAAVYSPHTAYDSAAGGINQQLADLLELEYVQPIRPSPGDVERGIAAQSDDETGMGRWGRLRRPSTLRDLARRIANLLQTTRVEFIGEPSRTCQTIGLGCGSAFEFFDDAARLGCDTYLTGEARFHDYLRAEAAGVALVLPGHYATERFAVETLARRIAAEWPELHVWASQSERDPVQRGA